MYFAVHGIRTPLFVTPKRDTCTSDTSRSGSKLTIHTVSSQCHAIELSHFLPVLSWKWKVEWPFRIAGEADRSNGHCVVLNQSYNSCCEILSPSILVTVKLMFKLSIDTSLSSLKCCDWFKQIKNNNNKTKICRHECQGNIGCKQWSDADGHWFFWNINCLDVVSHSVLIGCNILLGVQVTIWRGLVSFFNHNILSNPWSKIDAMDKFVSWYLHLCRRQVEEKTIFCCTCVSLKVTTRESCFGLRAWPVHSKNISLSIDSQWRASFS